MVRMEEFCYILAGLIKEQSLKKLYKFCEFYKEAKLAMFRVS